MERREKGRRGGEERKKSKDTEKERKERRERERACRIMTRISNSVMFINFTFIYMILF